MAVGFSNTNKPINPRGLDASPKGYNRAALYSGKALDFDGSNDELILDGFTMSGNVATLSFYLKADDWDANSFIFAAGTPEIVIGSTTGGNNLSFYDSSSWQTFGAISDTTSTNFFSIVFDGTTAIAYMNGVKFGDTLTITAIDLSSVTGVKLMAKYTGGAWFFNGQLSGFKIFNTALTPAQVSDLYNNPEKIVPTGVDNTALKLWLPMMEGAGTTAYDGSGNGNHGTISGATYVHGVGAPVAQSAVMDWNKGQNLLPYSEQFDQWSLFTGATTSANTTTAPDGQTTADTLNFASGNESLIYWNYGSGSATFTSSIWAKSSTGKKFTFRHWNGISAIRSSEFTTTSEWQRFDFTFTDPLVNVGICNEDNGNTGSIQIWGFQLEQASSVGAYIPSFATAQPNPVLLPQGLTSGRDITGVNLFENVRKQGALNLDGNSWAEVHDNASLDITDAITLEAWVYNDGSGFDGFLGRYFTTGNNRGVMIYEINNGTARMIVSKDGINTYNAYATISQGWNHIVGTCNDTEIKIYINGVKGTDGTAPSGSIHVSSYPYEIGRYNANITTQHTNQIAQPRIYNRALTASEVLRNYNSGKSTYQ